jgi:hypothetical protein
MNWGCRYIAWWGTELSYNPALVISIAFYRAADLFTTCLVM